MSNAAAVAFRAYTAAFLTRRSLWIVVGIAVLFLGAALLISTLSRTSSLFTSATLEGMRVFALIPGVPVAALLMSEIPVRDGIRHRTLLYHLLSPVPRSTLVVVRTLTTAVLLTAIMTAVVAVVRMLEGGSLAPLGREALAVLLGSLAYTTLFGLLHLLTRKGLIAGLAYHLLLDSPLGTFPFGLRNLAPSYHYRVIADQVVEMELPAMITVPEGSLVVSVVALVVITGLALFAVTFRFDRMQLPELC